MIKLGKYQHYKGEYYEVVGMAHHTETKSPMVLYKALYDIPELTKVYGDPVIFARPYSLFVESVQIKNEKVPRFRYIEN